tara:strand:- start:888 stop:1079 length:192 start_codon:yes stop_codon:yes gene_type:complete
MLKQKQKSKHKDFPGNLIKLNFIEQEIEYAKSQLQETDTGHIHTAISWMEHRKNQLKGIEDDE